MGELDGASVDVEAREAGYFRLYGGQNKLPILRCRPERVHGIPVARDTRRFTAVMPRNRFQLNPPRFGTSVILSGVDEGDLL